MELEASLSTTELRNAKPLSAVKSEGYKRGGLRENEREDWRCDG